MVTSPVKGIPLIISATLFCTILTLAFKFFPEPVFTQTYFGIISCIIIFVPKSKKNTPKILPQNLLTNFFAIFLACKSISITASISTSEFN